MEMLSKVKNNKEALETQKALFQSGNMETTGKTDDELQAELEKITKEIDNLDVEIKSIEQSLGLKRDEGVLEVEQGYKIVTNTALTYYARLKKEYSRTTSLDDALEYTEEGDVWEKMNSAHFEKEIVFIISSLPRKVSRLLHWSIREGLSQDEIAKREGVSVGAVKTRIHRAKKMLRDALRNSQLNTI
jgi:RNA polymerase sigma factor (sigma-70 family)